mgnify:CR=1 FL=1
MGALHEGHLSLVKKSLDSCNHTVASIFVNPAQFSPDEDFGSYPRDLAQDQLALESLGVDVLFLPDDKIIYPDNFSTYLEENKLSKGLESVSRPYFFKGVLTVVLKLFNIIKPQSVFFGKKDYQQFRLVEKMVEDLNLAINVVGGETIREKSGLAMSSRNEAFIDQEIQSLEIIYQSLKMGKDRILLGEKDTSIIKNLVQNTLLTLKGLTIDYIEITDLKNLSSLETINQSVLISLAVYFKNVRLIDNIEVVV